MKFFEIAAYQIGRTGVAIMELPQSETYTVEDIYALPEGQRAELIDGRIYNMAPPVRVHQHLVMNLSAAIHAYIKAKGGDCLVYPAPFAVFLNEDDRNYVEPDISVICDQGKLDEKGCNGAPDWIIEIVSPGNPGNDYVRKLNLYLDAGVREYWIVNPGNHTVFVYRLEKATFESIDHTFLDNIEVDIFDDFSICLKEFAQI